MNIQIFNYTVNVLQVLLWQYNDASALESLLTQKQNWYDSEQSDFWADWYTNVFNLVTANKFGLSVWSIILDIPFFVFDEPDKPTWGFGPYRKNFNNGNFSSDSGNSDVLTLEEQRFLLRLRYFQLCTNGNVNDINAFLNYLFTDPNCPYTGTVWVLDGLNMSMTYVIDCDMSNTMQQILSDYDLWPRPAGVLLKFVDAQRDTWGFGEFRKNFENGTFI